MQVCLNRSYFSLFSLFTILLFVSSPSIAAIDSAWLVSVQNPDGSFSAQNDIASPTQNTSEVLQALYSLDSIGLIGENLALQLVDASDAIHLDNIVRKIIANKQAGHDVSTLVSQLKSFINDDGGFGSIVGYQSTILDTALAIQALAVSESLLDNDVSNATAYLTNQQNTDGSWSSAGNEASIYITATVSRALQKTQAVYDVISNINAANSFLINKLQNEIATTDTFETAQVVLSISASVSDKTIYQFLLDHLNSTRDIDGSWQQDTYTTALAMRALHQSETGLSPHEDLLSVVDPLSNISAITGLVTDNLTGQVLSGVSITVTSENGDTVSSVSGVDGRYIISNLFPGNASVTVEQSGYHSLSGNSVLSSGVVHHFNPVLVQKPQPVPIVITGKVIDADSKLALAGVNVQVINSDIAAQTNASGNFQLNNIPPGSINVKISIPNYISKTYSISASAGGEMNLGLVALKAGISSGSVSIVSGLITDAISGKPLNGVTVSLFGTDDKTTFTNANGQFAFANVIPGFINISATLAGYKISTAGVDLLAGETTQFNAKLIKENDIAQTTIKGQVVDSQTLQPLPNVEIQIIGQAQLLQTNAEGEFQLGGITPGSLVINLSHVDYQDVFYSTTAVEGGIVNLGQIRLSTKVTNGSETTNGSGAKVSVGVPGTSDMWLAGMPDGSTNLTDFAPTHSPVLVTGLDLSAEYLTFSNVTGGVSHDPGCPSSVSCSIPDGEETRFYGHVRGALNKISNVRAPLNALMGVFLDDSQPDSSLAPATLNFETLGTDFTSISPELKQVFFIGDGLTGNGEGITQHFTIPEGATRLYLGTMDSWGWYNNSGVISVDVNVHKYKNPLVDLTITAFNIDKLSTSLNTLQVNGMAEVSIKNAGTARLRNSALVTVFEDNNADGLFETGTDNVLGELTVESALAIDAELTIDVPINGIRRFRDSPVYAMVDSNASITESDEDNNINHSMKLCRAAVSTPGQIVLQEKWYWNGSQSGIDNSNANVFGPVMVAQLNDDNGDSLINLEDTPDTVFVSYVDLSGTGTLRALNGADGQEIWSTDERNPSLFGSVALGDIDNDGFIEIIAINISRREIMAYEHTGELKWSKPSGFRRAAWDGVALADLNHDGQVEILHGRRVHDSNGELLWEGAYDNGGIVYGHMSIAADIDNTGDMEVIAGRTAYDSSGNVVWHRSDIRYDGFNAIANFDDDDFPEIVLVSRGNVYLLEHTGETIWGPVKLPGGGYGGAPTVADFDGDGQPEIGIAGSSRYVVFETDGAIKWQRATSDRTSHQTGSSLFDFEADGQAEILYADEQNLYIYDGATGETRVVIANGSLTTFEYPVVVDIDNDGQAEIVVAANTVTGRNGVRVYESGDGEWAPTRSIWNQHSYHINNINDDGSIPQNEKSSWLSHNTYRLNTFAERSAASMADITTALLRVNTGENQAASISARIGNGGELALAQAIKINFYEGDPASGGNLLGTVSLNSLASGAYQDIELSNIQALSGNVDIFVVADSGNAIAECNELNNTVSLPVFAGSLSASLAVGTSANQYVTGNQIPLQAELLNNSVIPGQFLVQLQIEDEQGVLIHDFAQASSGVLAGQSAININNVWDSTGLLTGAYRLRGLLFDIEGNLLSNTTTSLFSLTTSAAGQSVAALRTHTDRAVYNTSDVVIVDNLISNSSSDTLISDAQLLITISNETSGETFRQTQPLSVLTAGARQQTKVEYNFTNQPQGSYSINVQLLSQQNTLLASSQASYIVEADATKAIVGDAEVQAASLYQGQQQMCTDSLSNIGDVDLSSLTIQQQVVNIASEQIFDSQTKSINLDIGSNQILVRNINTSMLDIGDYACTLQVDINGAMQALDFATFTVTEPPINIDLSLSQRAFGRVLVLLDSQTQYDEEGNAFQSNDDPHGPADASTLSAQRAYITQLLDNMGWAYTVVEDVDSFSHELRSGGYTSYALFSEQIKLPNQVQEELREAVYRSEGLLVAGSHDMRNNKLVDALGIKVHGKDSQSTGFALNTSDLHDAASASFNFNSTPLRISSLGAEVIASYTGNTDASFDKTSNIAVTQYSYGEGIAIFVGFDLLAQAAKASIVTDALFAELLVNTLAGIDTTGINLNNGDVIPINLSLSNLGMATPGMAEIKLPLDSLVLDSKPAVPVINNDIHWAFNLAEDETEELTFWLRLPSSGGSRSIDAQVFTGTEPNLEYFDSQQIAVMITPSATLASVVTQIADLNNDSKAYKQAYRLINNAQNAYLANDYSAALTAALRASSELADIHTLAAAGVRHKLARVIRHIAQQQ